MAEKRTALDSLLNDQERQKFADYLVDRITSVSSSMLEFRMKREEYWAQMNDDFSWRGEGRAERSAVKDSELAIVVNDIFDLQNDSLNVVGGFAAFMSARTSDDIFGTDPYYAANPEGLADKPLSDSIQRHSAWKLGQSNFKESGLDAIDLAFGLGEAIIKITWDQDLDISERNAEILYIAGQEALTVDGQRITKEDVQMDVTPENVEIILHKSDPTFMAPMASATWEEVAIEETNVIYNGIRAETIYFKDFLCPITVSEFRKSDFLGHQYECRLSQLKLDYAIDKETLALLQSETDDPKAEVAQPRTEIGEAGEEGVLNIEPDPMIRIVECWVKHDPKGDGKIRRIKAVVAPDVNRIIFMDYAANESPKAVWPFFSIRAYPVKNRWYGRGYYETYARAQEYIDRQLNRIEYRNRYHTNPATFTDIDALGEGMDVTEVELAPGKNYRKKPGRKLEEIIEIFVFPDLDERTWQLMQFMIQIIQVRSGVTSAAQGEVSSLPSTSTATGIESILQSASTLARQPINCIKGGIESALKYSLSLIYTNMDRPETYSYYEGEEQMAAVLDNLTVADLEMNVRLLLTKFKDREAVEKSAKAIEFFNQYIAVPEPEKAAGRPLFVQAIKGLGFDQADTIIRPAMTMEEIAAAQMALGAPQPGEEGQPEPGGLE